VWGVALYMLGIYTGQNWLQWFGFGFTAHVLGDALTKQGVPLLGPFITRNISFTSMRTGGAVESLFGMLLWGAVGLLLLGDSLARLGIASPSFELLQKFYKEVLTDAKL